jgi:hypothetical protein
MKKKYPSPVFTYLDFLRANEPSSPAHVSRGRLSPAGFSATDLSLAHIAKVEIDKER